MHNKKIKILIAFDVGLKNIGTAIGNTLTKKARPLSIIKNRNINETFKEIQILINTWEPNYFIVGIPYNNNIYKNSIYKYCLEFSKKLFLIFKIKVIKIDENYSSVVVQKNKTKFKDSYSASIILQTIF